MVDRQWTLWRAVRAEPVTSIFPHRAFVENGQPFRRPPDTHPRPPRTPIATGQAFRLETPPHRRFPPDGRQTIRLHRCIRFEPCIFGALPENEYLELQNKNGHGKFTLREGHPYRTVFIDMESGRIVHAVDGRNRENFAPFPGR